MKVDIAEQKQKEKWENTKNMICSNGNQGHAWLPVSWSVGRDSKHVSTIMCTRCFCHLSINDGYRFGAKPTED